MLVLALVIRRSFCGQICPLGALQGLFGSLGGKLFRKRPEIPRGDRSRRTLPQVRRTGVLRCVDLAGRVAGHEAVRSVGRLRAHHLCRVDCRVRHRGAILAVSLAGSLVYERFFCKYLCPTGALLGLLSKVSLRHQTRCGRVHRLRQCDKACPMNIEVSTADTVTDPSASRATNA